MDQRKEAVFRYIDEHRQEILDDWKALVNHEGSLRQPDAMHAEAEYLCGRFREAGVDCAVYSAAPEIPPVVAGEIGTGRPGKPVIFAGHFDTVFNPGTFGENPFRIEGDKAYGPGVLDMKGGIIIALWTIKALEAAGYDERPIRVCSAAMRRAATSTIRRLRSSAAGAKAAAPASIWKQRRWTTACA